MRGIATGPGLSIITTSSQLLKDCFSPDPASSDFWNIFTPVSLPPLTEEAMGMLLTALGERSGVSLLDYRWQIEALAGGVPSLVQLACHHYYEAARDQVGVLSQEAQEQIKRNVAQDARPQLRRIWESLAPDETKAVREIARNAQVAAENSVVAGLRAKGYVQANRLFSPLMCEFVLALGQ